jgi:hypothetical protein
MCDPVSYCKMHSSGSKTQVCVSWYVGRDAFKAKQDHQVEFYRVALLQGTACEVVSVLLLGKFMMVC